MFTLTQILFVALLVAISYLVGFIVSAKNLVDKAYFYKKHAEFMTIVADTTLHELRSISELSEGELTDLISEKVKIKIASQ